MTDVKPDSANGGETEKLLSVKAHLRQYSQAITAETSYGELKQMVTKILKSIPLKTSIDQTDKEDLTIYLCCLLRIKIAAQQEHLDIFISRSLQPIEPVLLRQNFYNHRKNKKVQNLSAILGYGFKELQNRDQDAQSDQSFCKFYKAWLQYVTGDEGPITHLCPEVFAMSNLNEKSFSKHNNYSLNLEI